MSVVVQATVVPPSGSKGQVAPVPTDAVYAASSCSIITESAQVQYKGSGVPADPSLPEG